MNEKIFSKLNELAEQAGCITVKDSYNEVHMSILQKDMKQYAVLGDVNSGKSTVINILAEEKKLPVSMRTNEHGKVAYAESEKYNCRWVELNSNCYQGDNLTDVNSPLWHIDAAIYIMCATAPFSQQDVTAIRACIAHGVPCSLVLSKLDLIDEAERDEVTAFVKVQSERYFGSDSLTVINVKDEESARKAVLNEFISAEDSSDIRDYMLAISYAKKLKEYIEEKYECAKEKMQAVSEKEKHTKQVLFDEKIAWDKINLEIEASEIRLVEAMSLKMNQMYADCIVNLADKAMQAKSPKEWWEKSLENEFRQESIRISNEIDRMICTQISYDRDWLVQAAEQSLGAKLLIDGCEVETRLDDVLFGVSPDRLNDSSKTKPLAIAGLLASSVVLFGVLLYPAITMHTINSVCWTLAGAAVAGCGFWTFFETKKDKAEKQQCLKSELSRYILMSRDDNINALKKNIEYGYESMRISVQDLQLACVRPAENKDDEKVYSEFKEISAIKLRCDEIVKEIIVETK